MVGFSRDQDCREIVMAIFPTGPNALGPRRRPGSMEGVDSDLQETLDKTTLAYSLAALGRIITVHQLANVLADDSRRTQTMWRSSDDQLASSLDVVQSIWLNWCSSRDSEGNMEWSVLTIN